MKLTTKQSADLVGVSTATVIRWINDGKITGRKDGRAFKIDQKSLEVFAGICRGQEPFRSRYKQILDNLSEKASTEQIGRAAFAGLFGLVGNMFMSVKDRKISVPATIATAFLYQKNTDKGNDIWISAAIGSLMTLLEKEKP